MSCIYKEYRRWIGKAEANIRMRLPGCNVEISEHRPGAFVASIGRPCVGNGIQKKFYLSLEQIMKLAEGSLDLKEVLGPNFCQEGF